MSETWTSDMWQDPDVVAWVHRAQRELVPMLDASAVTAMLMPTEQEVDIKFAVELGLSIMLDKPIIIMRAPGREPPEKLRRIADAEITFHVDDPEASRRELRDALRKLGIIDG